MHLAELYEDRGEESKRVEASRQAAALASDLAQRRPELARLKAVALSRTAQNLNSTSDWRKAAPVWQQAIVACRAALEQDPHDWQMRRGLAVAHDGLARCWTELDNLPGARQHLEEAVHLFNADLDTAPAKTRLAMQVSFELIDLAWVEHRLGSYKEAVAHAQQAYALQQHVAGADADNFAAPLEMTKTLVTTA